MKYILMCGGKYNNFETPKHLFKVNGEVILERTIRLLKENGIKDISISTSNPAFDYLGLPILKHNNSYEYKDGKIYGFWCDAFYPTDEPTCYIFGDVYFSEEAIKTIINTETEDIEMFGSVPPFSINYPKKWIEPFALKVVNTDHLKSSIQRTKELALEGKLWRKNPIMWELWTVIKNVPLQTKAEDYIYNYIAINDYTSDIDSKEDIRALEKILKIMKGELKMIKVEVIEEFTLGKFNQLRNITRKNNDKDETGKLFIGDTFECDEEIAEYLTGKNYLNRAFVKIIEVIPEEVPENFKEVIPEKLEVPEVVPEVKPKSTRTARKRK